MNFFSFPQKLRQICPIKTEKTDNLVYVYKYQTIKNITTYNNFYCKILTIDVEGNFTVLAIFNFEMICVTLHCQAGANPGFWIL